PRSLISTTAPADAIASTSIPATLGALGARVLPAQSNPCFPWPTRLTGRRSPLPERKGPAGWQPVHPSTQISMSEMKTRSLVLLVCALSAAASASSEKIDTKLTPAEQKIAWAENTIQKDPDKFQ